MGRAAVFLCSKEVAGTHTPLSMRSYQQMLSREKRLLAAMEIAINYIKKWEVDAPVLIESVLGIINVFELGQVQPKELR